MRTSWYYIWHYFLHNSSLSTYSMYTITHKNRIVKQIVSFLLGQHDIIFVNIFYNFTILLCKEKVSILWKTWNTPWTRLLPTRKLYLLESPFWASGFFWNTRWNIWKISTAQSCKNLFEIFNLCMNRIHIWNYFIQ